jgi:hypothetical protein
MAVDWAERCWRKLVLLLLSVLNTTTSSPVGVNSQSRNRKPKYDKNDKNTIEAYCAKALRYIVLRCYSAIGAYISKQISQGKVRILRSLEIETNPPPEALRGWLPSLKKAYCMKSPTRVTLLRSVSFSSLGQEEEKGEEEGKMDLLPEAKILDLILSFVVHTNPQRRGAWRPRAYYLKDINGLTLVCKAFNASIWRNHPTFVILKAHKDAVRLLRKIPQLRELKVTVRATSIAGDIQLFQRSLLLTKRRFENLTVVLPNLQLLHLTPSIEDISMRYAL